MNLKKYFNQALNYDDYVKNLGDNLELHFLHYKKFDLTEKHANTIAKYKGCDILVLTEPWCGDSLAYLPVLKKITEAGKGWRIKVLFRDQNPELMTKFLTHGTCSIPLLFFLDKYGNLIFRWGPRVKVAQQIFDNKRQMIREGIISKGDVLKQIRFFYAKDRGQHFLKELMKLLNTYQLKKDNYLGNKLLEMKVTQ